MFKRVAICYIQCSVCRVHNIANDTHPTLYSHRHYDPPIRGHRKKIRLVRAEFHVIRNQILTSWLVVIYSYPPPTFPSNISSYMRKFTPLNVCCTVILANGQPPLPPSVRTDSYETLTCLQDLSTNGFIHNGIERRGNQSIVLNHGDTLEIGGSAGRKLNVFNSFQVRSR